MSKFLILFAALLIGGCNYTIEKKVSENAELVSYASHPEDLDFAILKRTVFDRKCVSCHGGGELDFNSYESVKSNLRIIERRALAEKTMPPGRPLSGTEIDAITAWIVRGAIEGKPVTPPIRIALKPTFTSIKTNILDGRCIRCHSGDGPAKHIPLGKITDLTNSPRDIVVPNTPDESGIVIAITRDDEKRMPPPKNGAKKLSDEEINTIIEWIKLGTPE